MSLLYRIKIGLRLWLHDRREREIARRWDQHKTAVRHSPTRGEYYEWRAARGL